MRLVAVRVRLYRNIVDSQWVRVDDSITGLIGKNESGKTAFLQALYSLKPAWPSTVETDVVRNYPRWRMKRDKKNGDLNRVNLVTARFSLDENEVDRIYQSSSESLPSARESVTLRTSRSYGGSFSAWIELSPERLADSLSTNGKLPGAVADRLAGLSSMAELSEVLEEAVGNIDGRTKEARPIKDAFNMVRRAERSGGWKLSDEVASVVEEMLPSFFYYGAYSGLEGRINLEELSQKDPEKYEKEDQTAAALLNLAGVSSKELMQPNFEIRTAELEAAANEITSQIFEYWSQNKELIVQFKIDPVVVDDQSGQNVVNRFLDVRLNDLRHQMTTNFSTRSTGFQWFFSFIAAFSEFEDETEVVLLLDEPGLGLHARAQKDLLDYVQERLAPDRQVIYTNHSPFFVNPKRLERIRLVQDRTERGSPDAGATISEEVLSVDDDTLFPLQAALGYDLAQHLGIGSYNLVVEGPSDLVYLKVFGSYLEEQGEFNGLDDRITIVPVGGADKIPTFVALLGAHLDELTVLIDGQLTSHQRLQDMIGAGILKKKRLVGVSSVAGQPDASIEDLFTPSEYLSLYNEAFSTNVKEQDLVGSDSIIRQLERERGGKFDHLRPAIILLEERDRLSMLSEDTVQHFADLVGSLNATFGLEAERNVTASR